MIREILSRKSRRESGVNLRLNSSSTSYHFLSTFGQKVVVEMLSVVIIYPHFKVYLDWPDGSLSFLFFSFHSFCLFRRITGENVHYGTPTNPQLPSHIPGGSSSGSAVAVASGRVDFALGIQLSCCHCCKFRL